MIILAWVIFIASGAGMALFLYRRFVLRSHLQYLRPGDTISTKDFALLERDINNLKQVIVVCDQVESPSDLLYDSIKDNLGEGVKYKFFVSSDKLDKSKAEPLTFFKNAERLKLGLTEDQPTTLTEILDLGHQRNDNPYVFLVSNGGDSNKVICFKGTEIGVGVASSYTFVDQDIARNLFNILARSFPKFVEEREQADFAGSMEAGMIELRGTAAIDEASDRRSIFSVVKK